MSASTGRTDVREDLALDPDRSQHITKENPMFHHTDLNLINARRRELEAQAAQHRLTRSAQRPRATPTALVLTLGTHAQPGTRLRHRVAARKRSSGGRVCDQHHTIDVKGSQPRVAEGTA